MRSASKIPRLRLLIEQIANRAEAQGLTVYASSLPAAYLIRADEEVLVVTHRKGYLRIKKEHIQPLIEELANMQDEKYLIRALESVEDFKKEGRQNHNCVGTYADRAIRGKVKIFVLRKADTPNESFVTIELAPDEKSIKQCYGRGNSLPDEEVKAWVDHWLKTVVNKKKRRTKAA